ncbi:MAG: ABC transporter ATP-binding protein [Dehalococcoidia bacterium]|nr:ABC transporter ATP-binding protein [Dehalococcoidia bacterium]
MRRRTSSVILRLLAFAVPYWRTILLAWLCVAGASAFVLLMPLLVKWAIDTGLDVQNGVPTGDKQTLIILGAAVIGVAVGRGAFAYGQQYLGEWIAQRVAYDIRNAIYNHLQRLSFAYHDKAQTGQVMSRATQDVEGVRLFISMGVLRLVYVAILLFGTLAFMLVTSWKLALVSWVFLPILAARSIQVTMRLRPIWMKVQDLQGRLGTVLQENLSGMRVVKAFAREQYESVKFAKEAKDLFENAYETNRIQAFNQPMLTGIWMLAMVTVAWFGALQIDAGALDPGELAAFAILLTLLQLPVRSLGWIVMLFARAQSSGQRIFDILDAESAVQEKADAREMAAVEGHVRFEGVSFAYDAVSPVLHETDIDARPGEIVALLGPTGSGKTTIVNLMPRFYDVTGGRIAIDGVDIRDVTLASLRHSIGIVQQDVFLFSATVRENIAYGAVGASQEDIERVAQAARIHEFIMSLPHGYDTWVGERGVTLSGGQRQRLSIARTLLMDPKILVFDDSTSSVDTETEYLIQQALAELMTGRTTFVIAQRLRTVKAADQILVLQEGRIVERGRHEELIARDGLYRQIYDLELRDQEEAFEQAVAAQAAPAGGAGG